MTHIIVKDGAVAVSGGRVVTDAGGAPCCCGPGGGDGGVCPGRQGYCIRVELVDFDTFGCVTEATFSPGGRVLVDELVVNGPLTVTMTEPTSSGGPVIESITGTGLASYSNVFNGTPIGWDTDITARVFISCEPSTQRPYLVSCDAEISGRGVPGPRLSADRNLFIGNVESSPRVYLDEGPVLIPNLYRDEDVYPGTACTPDASGPPLAITASGFMRIEPLTSDSCDGQLANQILAVACDGSGDDVVVDPFGSGGFPLVEYESRIYKPLSRVDGVPQEVLWVDGVCENPDPDGGGGGGSTGGPGDPQAGNAGTDAGGPTDSSAFQLGDAVERAIKAITLNQLATCPACQRRREVLNQFGLTVGRAVLRRLGW